MSDSSLKKGRFTKFSNRIGLYSNQSGNYIANTPEVEVVLNFPFKDTVLEGGMTKEDAGRDERFLHLEIDKKDIDTLADPKVLTNFKYIDQNGETELTANSDIKFFDEDDNLTQNLLIKGNNLLALYSLREKLAGKVKLIYIDPPYNTGSDGFRYNDGFNHSAWLTFMQNRLEIAKQLLRDDGVLFISCDDNEQAYLKVLCDEIFNTEQKNNFVATLPTITNLKGNQDEFAFAGTHEYLLVYAKNKEQSSFGMLEIEDQDELEAWEQDEKGFYKKGANLKATGVNAPRNKRPNLFYPIYITQDNKVSLTRTSETDIELLPITDGEEMSWRWQKSTLQEHIDDVIVSNSGHSYSLYKKQRPELGDLPSKKPKSIFYKPEYSSGNGTNQIVALFGSKVFPYPKPEGLIKDIISISTREGDLILDFCLGSGTTSAVAHKMNRRWIGIEQMDYIETVSKERLKKVIDGEQGGISKDVNWQGGGSFVYMELKKYNQDFLDRLMEVTSIADVEAVYEDMQKNAFLKFFFDKREFEKDENFRSKTWEERRDMLVDILDENQLYLNLQGMRDVKHKVSNDEITLTERFYGVKENGED